MVKTASNMMPLGTIAPDFELFDTVSQTTKSLSELRGEQGTVIMFICNHCPFVKHINAGLVQLAQDYDDKGIGFIAISSNDVANYPQDGPKQMHEHAQEQRYPFAYLYDETQDVAKAYDAACTPDIYIFDAQLACVYRGQLDYSRPGNDIEVTGKDCRDALNHLLSGQPINSDQKPSVGCNIKWKS